MVVGCVGYMVVIENDTAVRQMPQHHPVHTLSACSLRNGQWPRLHQQTLNIVDQTSADPLWQTEENWMLCASILCANLLESTSFDKKGRRVHLLHQQQNQLLRLYHDKVLLGTEQVAHRDTMGIYGIPPAWYDISEHGGYPPNHGHSNAQNDDDGMEWVGAFSDRPIWWWDNPWFLEWWNWGGG